MCVSALAAWLNPIAPMTASDEELDRVLQAVCPPSDDDIDHVLQLVQQQCRDRFARRGFLLCQYMRARKRVASLSQAPKIAPHVQALIDQHNSDCAKTLEEVITLSEKKRKVVKGTGAYRKWLPAALQRSCWGLRTRRRVCKTPRLVARRQRGKRREPAAAPTTTSTRTYAVFSRSSAKYVQDIRNAVSEKFVQLQADAFAFLPRDLDLIVLEIAFDETEEPITLGQVRSETVHVMTLHGRIFYRAGMEHNKIELVMPPAVLESTSANNLKAALLRRLPWSLHSIKSRCKRFVLLVNSDSGAACLRLGRHLSEMAASLPAPCKMHQGCLAMTSIFGLSGFMSAIFCGALLLRRRRVQELLRSALKNFVSKHLVITYSAPSPADQAHSRAVFGMLRAMLVARLHDEDHDRARSTPRLAAWRRLKDALRGPLDSEAICHFCPWGCHSTRSAAAQEIASDFITVFFDHPPAIPAWNKWSKLVPPLLWFTTATAIHTIMRGVMGDLCKLREGELEEFNEDVAVGMDTQRSYLQQDLVRFRKTQVFLSADCTADKLMACSLTLQPFLYLMNKCFKASRRFEVNTPSILMFIHSDSPAIALIKRYLEYIGDERHERWAPLLGHRAWSTQLYVMASTPMWMIVAQLMERFVLPFRSWPWRLGLLVGDRLNQASKRALAEQLLDTCEHVDSFTKEYKVGLHSVAHVLAPQHIQHTADVFCNVPISNIVSEASFAASHVRRQSTHGNEPVPSTVAANHVLATAKTNLDLVVAQQQRLQEQQRPRKARVKVANAWQKYLQVHRKEGSMRQLAHRWSGLGCEQRQAYQPLDEPPVVEGPCSTRLPRAQTRPWPGCGDDFYPISESELSHVAQHVPVYSAAWKARVGGEPIPPGPNFEAPVIHTCQEKVGDRGCQHNIDPATLANIELIHKRLDRWSTMTKPRATPLDQPWGQRLQLFYFGDRPGIAHADREPRGVAFLMIGPRLRQQVLYMEACAPPKPEDTISFTPSIANLHSRAECTDIVLQTSPAAWLKVDYRQVGLASYLVVSVGDMAEWEREEATKRAQAAELARLAKVARTDSGVATASRRAKSARPPTPSGSGADGSVVAAGDIDPHPGAGGDVDGALAAWDYELAQGSEEESHEDPVAELMGEVPDAEMGEMDEALEHAGSDVATDDEETLEEALPIVDMAGQVRNPKDASDVWGRISVVREGQPSEAVSIYCRRHGCSIMKRTKDAIAVERVLQWFLLGQSVPTDRSAAAQNHHKKLFGEV